MQLVQRVDRVIEKLELVPGPAVVAVSGGPDSVALLDLLAHSRSASRLSFHVAHLDHGIHPMSGGVLDTVRGLAEQYGFPFHGARIQLGAGATETRAREARYQWLDQVAESIVAEVIFTAHQRDDQVETVLMRILRGTGPAGLAGMALRRGRVVRPLLAVPHAALVEHVRLRGLPSWDDPANRDPRHQRSWVRSELIPFLRERVPDIEVRLTRLAHQAAGHRAAWDRLLDREEFDLRRECDGVSVAASPMRDYDSQVVRALLGALGRRAGCHVGPMRAARIEQLLAGGRSGAVAQLGNGCAAELSFGRLRVFREPVAESARVEVPIEGGCGTNQIGRWQLAWSTGSAPDHLERRGMASWFSPGRYSIRLWQPGDRIRPLGGNGRRLVVRCMQDAHIARSNRAGWPVVERGGTIVWVPGVSRSDEAIPVAGQPALRIDAHHG